MLRTLGVATNDVEENGPFNGGGGVGKGAKPFGLLSGFFNLRDAGQGLLHFHRAYRTSAYTVTAVGISEA